MHGRTSHTIRPLAWRSVATVAAAALLASSACVLHHAEDVAPNRAVITEDEIDSLHASNAFEAVNKLRPMFLIARGKVTVDATTRPAYPNVYVDNQFYGDITALKYISAATIESIQFFNASEAQYKFGRGNAAGVIDILTKH